MSLGFYVYEKKFLIKKKCVLIWVCSVWLVLKLLIFLLMFWEHICCECFLFPHFLVLWCLGCIFLLRCVWLLGLLVVCLFLGDLLLFFHRCFWWILSLLCSSSLGEFWALFNKYWKICVNSNIYLVTNFDVFPFSLFWVLKRS